MLLGMFGVTGLGPTSPEKKVPAIVTAKSEGEMGTRHPTVRFEAQGGQIVEKKLTDPLRGGIEVGDEVTVIYTPSLLLRPGEYARLSPDDRLPLAWPLSCLKIVGISLVVLVFSILMISSLIVLLAAVLLS
jgi:hypothetical protein